MPVQCLDRMFDPRSVPDSASGIDVGFKGALDLLGAWRDGRTPDPELTVSRWADSHRLLSPRGANEADALALLNWAISQGIGGAG